MAGLKLSHNQMQTQILGALVTQLPYNLLATQSEGNLLTKLLLITELRPMTAPGD